MPEAKTKYYYGAVGSKGSTRADGGPFWPRVYHYEPDGNTQVVDLGGRAPLDQTLQPFSRKEEAIDFAADYCEDHGFDNTELDT